MVFLIMIEMSFSNNNQSALLTYIVFLIAALSVLLLHKILMERNKMETKCNTQLSCSVFLEGKMNITGFIP